MITPMTSIQIPWYIAKATSAAVAPLIISLEFIGDFWRTWEIVYGANK